MTDRTPDCSFCPCFAGWIDENDPYNVPGVLRNYDGKPVCEDCYRQEPFYVNVYEVGQGYGGAEEGGWWFECGNPISSVLVEDWDAASSLRDELKEKFPDTGKSSSVLGGEDYRVRCERHFARSYPESRPYYE